MRKTQKENDNNKKTFGLIGAAGFIAPRHLEAISSNGCELLAAVDPNDSVGVLDRHFPEARFFTSFERFERFLAKLNSQGSPADYISICSPNHLHDTHCRVSLNNGSNAICEKPLVLRPENLDVLKDAEIRSGQKIFCILQLRHHQKIIALKKMVKSDRNRIFSVRLKYITTRGPWYDISWKGDGSRSGGILFNIGVHFFDMLIDVFGAVDGYKLTHLDQHFARGFLYCQRANIEWELSTRRENLPSGSEMQTFRELSIDEERIEFSQGFADLHTESYREILKGRGFGIDEVYPSIKLIDQLKRSL